MKVSCPNCNKTLQAPDEWAGRKVKCPGCKHAISLPADQHDDPGNGLNLASLESIEAAGQLILAEPKKKRKPMTLKEAQAAAAAATTAQQGSDGRAARSDPRERICPQCGEKVRVDDLYCDVMCRHCGTAIPGMAIRKAGEVRYAKLADRLKSSATFYNGFVGAAFYPLPAFGAIGAGMAIALGAIALPLMAILAFAASSSLNPISAKEGSDFSWVGVFLTVMFAAEGVYFGSVAYYILIDTIRATTSGGEQPPALTWNIMNLGLALAGYVGLIVLYGVIALLLIYIAEGTLPTQTKHIAALAKPANLVVLALLTFSVPMNVLGLASPQPLDGLNPVKVFLSIWRLIGHYTFLFLIVVLYLGVFVGITAGVLSWAGPKIMAAAGKGIGEGLLKMLSGIGAWGVLIGLAFYFAYSMGRILGLFCRTYREQLAFDL